MSSSLKKQSLKQKTSFEIDDDRDLNLNLPTTSQIPTLTKAWSSQVPSLSKSRSNKDRHHPDLKIDLMKMEQTKF